MNACKCGRPTDRYVCEDCCQELARALGEVPWADRELDSSIAGSRGIDYAAMGTAAPTASCSCGDDVDCGHAVIPWNDQAAEAQRHLRATLVSWVHLCDEEQVRSQDYRDGYPADTLPSMSRWLLWRVDGLALHHAGPEAVEQITDAVGRCMRAIDRRPDRAYAGPCDCGADLYAKPGHPEVRCRVCGRTYQVEAMLEWMRAQVSDQLVTVREGAGLLSRFGMETTTKVIEGWVRRQRLVAHGERDGRAVYRFNDLVQLAAQRVA